LSPFTIVSTSRTIERRKIKRLRKAGAQATTGQLGDRNEEQIEVTEEELYKASDETIEMMREAIMDEETFKMSGPIKDSSDKSNLIRVIKKLLFKIIGQKSD